MRYAPARLAAALVLAAPFGIAAADPPSTPAEERAGPGPRPAPDGGALAPDGGTARDRDQEVIDHLDELERLDLLEHLGLLDESGEDPPPVSR